MSCSSCSSGGPSPYGVMLNSGGAGGAGCGCGKARVCSPLKLQGPFLDLYASTSTGSGITASTILLTNPPPTHTRIFFADAQVKSQGTGADMQVIVQNVPIRNAPLWGWISTGTNAATGTYPALGMSTYELSFGSVVPTGTYNFTMAYY